MEKKQLQTPEQIVQSLINLRNELMPIYLGRSGEAASIVMKINSCLYKEYPTKK